MSRTRLIKLTDIHWTSTVRAIAMYLTYSRRAKKYYILYPMDNCHFS
jgi:hypothetical protein